MANTKAAINGIILAITFIGVLVLIFSPIFEEGKNGLQFADDLFNKLSKGSSNFLKKIEAKNEPFIGKAFSVAVKLEKPDAAVKILEKAGAQVKMEDEKLVISGDLGKLMSNILKDSSDMYNNDGSKVSARYDNPDGKAVLKTWWIVLKAMDKQLKKDGKIEEASIVSEVSKKTVEPAYNFYGIEAQSVKDKAILMTGLLVFYVIYTMWWGFAIFYIFEGIGLSMKKAKVKKEV